MNHWSVPKGGPVAIHYKTRDLGYGSEEGSGLAFVTTEVDSWGKRTILLSNGRGYDPIYLFADEWTVDDAYATS